MPQFFELHRLRFLQGMTISPIPPPNPTLRPKPIPYTSFCQNIPRICGVVFDFSAEVCHGYPHKLKIFHCNMSPDFFCDVAVRPGTAFPTFEKIVNVENGLLLESPFLRNSCKYGVTSQKTSHLDTFNPIGIEPDYTVIGKRYFTRSTRRSCRSFNNTHKPDYIYSQTHKEESDHQKRILTELTKATKKILKKEKI